MILVLCCDSKTKKAQNREQKITSRIKSSELKKIIPHLIHIQKTLFEDEMRDKNYSSDALLAIVFSTQNHLYVRFTVIDCNSNSFYSFQEKFQNNYLNFMINSNSIKPERFFDLQNLKMIPRSLENGVYCHDWYWVESKFKLINNDLKLERISTFYDSSYPEGFFDHSDSIYLIKNQILIEEPEPNSSTK